MIICCYHGLVSVRGGGSGIVLALYIYPSGPHDLHHSVYVTKY